MAWNIQAVATCFVKRRDYPQEHTFIVHLLRFRHLSLDYILCSRRTR